MKFKSKPKVITVEQFFPHEQRWPINVICLEKDEYKVWNELHESYINIKPGDWIRVDYVDDTYPIAQEYMEENYEPYDES